MTEDNCTLVYITLNKEMITFNWKCIPFRSRGPTENVTCDGEKYKTQRGSVKVEAGDFIIFFQIQVS